MLKRVADRIRRLARPAPQPEPSPGYTEPEERIYQLAAPYTATDRNRVLALIEAVRYVHRAQVAGVLLECGVLRGGSMMVAAATLIELGVKNRELHLFDTFEGMTKPEERDVSILGQSAPQRFKELQQPDGSVDWCNASLQDVRRNMALTGYPAEYIHYVQGPVEQTLPSRAPQQIALLRLDTDWYASTRHELEHLYPRLAPGGVLIVDDYHWWRGSREAVDEYISKRNLKLYPINGGGVAAVKHA